MAMLVVLPVVFSSTKAYAQDVTHHLYITRLDSTTADEDTFRSLILANLPVSTTDTHLRYLFKSQLNAGLVEKVYFKNGAFPSSHPAPDRPTKSSKKRKRMTAEDIETSLEIHGFPDAWGAAIHTCSEYAVVTFVDRPSMEISFRAARKAAKSQKTIFWGRDIKGTLPELREQLYTSHNKLQYPSRQELLRSTENYLTVYAEMEEARARENAKKRQMPDEDGFVTVMKGSRGFVRKEDADVLVEKAKEKTKGLDNFYRFQTREKRKEEQSDLMGKFEEDKRKVDEMKLQRGRSRPN